MQNSKMDAPTLTQMGKGKTGILKLNLFKVFHGEFLDQAHRIFFIFF